MYTSPHIKPNSKSCLITTQYLDSCHAYIQRPDQRRSNTLDILPTCASFLHAQLSSFVTPRGFHPWMNDLLRPVSLSSAQFLLHLDSRARRGAREDLQPPRCCSPTQASSVPFPPFASSIDPAYASHSAPPNPGCLLSNQLKSHAFGSSP